LLTYFYCILLINFIVNLKKIFIFLIISAIIIAVVYYMDKDMVKYLNSFKIINVYSRYLPKNHGAIVNKAKKQVFIDQYFTIRL